MSREYLKNATLLCCLLLLSFLIRYQFVENTQVINPIIADAKQYATYAVNLSKYNVFSMQFVGPEAPPDSLRSPGYPLFLSFLLPIIDNLDVYACIVIVQVFISSITVLLTYILGTLFLPKKWAFGAAVLTMLSPHLISMNNYVLTETLFTALLVLFALTFILMITKNSKAYAIISALVFGAAYLTNQTILFIPFLFFGVKFLKDYKGRGVIERDTLVNVLLFSVISVVFVLSWGVRNESTDMSYHYSSKRRMLSTMSHGTYPDFIYESERYKYYPYREDPRSGEFVKSYSNFFKIFFERASERPLRYFSWYIFEKPYYFWSWDILQGQGDVYIYPVKSTWYNSSSFAKYSRLFMKFIHVPILLIGIFGLIFLSFQIKREKARSNNLEASVFLAIILVYYTLLYTIFASWSRYSIPLRPELYLFAIWTLYASYSLKYISTKLGQVDNTTAEVCLK